MSSILNKSVKTTTHNSVDNDDESFCSAMQLSISVIFTPVLVAAIDLDLFGIIAERSSGASGACVSSSETASQLRTKNLNAPSVLDQMLRLLASHSLLTSSTRALEDGKVEILYGISPVGKFFVANEDGVSLALFANLNQYYDLTEICSHIKQVVLEGGNPCMNSKFEVIRQHEKIDIEFDKAMSETSTLILKKVFQIYKGFEGIRTLVDVGGGIGTTLGIIISTHPSIHGINFDLPCVIQKAPSSNSGIEHVSGDMFVEIPKSDAILMKNCYSALPESGKVIVIESLLPSAPETTTLARFVSHLDNIMLSKMEAKERTEQEYKALALGAGFSKFNVQPTCFAQCVMELYK